MKSICLVIIGLTSSIFCGVSLLPSAHAQCILTADPCSTEAGSEECCFPSLGAVCDTFSGGGTCCFPTKDDETAVCTQNNDCCGGLLCIAGVCSGESIVAFEDYLSDRITSRFLCNFLDLRSAPEGRGMQLLNSCITADTFCTTSARFPALFLSFLLAGVSIVHSCDRWNTTCTICVPYNLAGDQQ